jgi:hypothetical protein
MTLLCNVRSLETKKLIRIARMLYQCLTLVLPRLRGGISRILSELKPLFTAGVRRDAGGRSKKEENQRHHTANESESLNVGYHNFQISFWIRTGSDRTKPHADWIEGFESAVEQIFQYMKLTTLDFFLEELR